MLRKIYFGLFDLPHPPVNGRGHEMEKYSLGNEKRGPGEEMLSGDKATYRPESSRDRRLMGVSPSTA